EDVGNGVGQCGVRRWGKKAGKIGLSNSVGRDEQCRLHSTFKRTGESNTLLSKVVDLTLRNNKWKNTKNLNTKISKLNEELSDYEDDLYHYKIGLSQVEARLVEFKTQEIKFSEKIRGLERDVEIRNNKIEYITNELEEAKKEKESLDNKLTVPPPPAQVYSPPKKDLSWTGLPEFVDDIVTDNSRPTTSIDTSNSVTSDLQSNNSSISELGESSGSIMSKPMIKFVKAADCPKVTKTNNIENARKSTVRYAEIQVNTARPKAVINVVRTNRVNDVKASGCWVWKPIKPNSASITLKRYDYVDVRGRSSKSRSIIQRITMAPPSLAPTKNTENLNTKISKLNEELSNCETDLFHYKRGLSHVEAGLVEFKEHEIKFCEKIRDLERDVKIRDNKIEYLKNELEQVKKEKESLDIKLTGFEKASKDLDNLLGSQR
nr:hypothetical protein [Tanacetum cinerariifolium]